MKDLSLKALAIKQDGGAHRVILVNGKSVLKHRYIMELHLGRKLSSKEIVHHINGCPSDNRLENLTIMTSKEHCGLHARERMHKREEKITQWLKSIGR